MSSLKQVFIEYKQKKVGLFYSTNVLMHLVFNKSYKRIKDIADGFGVKMPPRKGFVFLKEYDWALWCIHLDDNPNWMNQLDSTGTIISEKKMPGETSEQFQKRIRKGHFYDVNLIRLCFAKENGMYRFVGAFKLSMVDFDNQKCIFKKVQDPQFVVTLKKRKKVTIIIEEEITEEISILL